MKGSMPKKLAKIVERFEKNKNLDEFAGGISEIAEKMNTSSMLLYMTVAGHMNLKYHDGEFYQCEEAKLGKVNCARCRHFMHEADTCTENSVITPVYRILHPEYEPPHFENGREPTCVIIERNRLIKSFEEKE